MFSDAVFIHCNYLNYTQILKMCSYMPRFDGNSGLNYLMSALYAKITVFTTKATPNWLPDNFLILS